MRVEKGVNLLWEEVSLEGAEKLFGLGQGPPELCDALSVLLEGHDIGDGLFMAVTVTDDEVQFDAHRSASPGVSGRGRVRVILSGLLRFPPAFPCSP